MKGYCEACKRESSSERDEYGVECCTDCGGDILIDMHIAIQVGLDPDGDYFNTKDDFDAFLARD